MPGGRLIVASARLPVTLSRRQGAWEAQRSTGGLVTALEGVANRRKFVWLGLPGGSVPEEDRRTVSQRLMRDG